MSPIFRPLRVGTIGSASALRETERVLALLALAGFTSERVVLDTGLNLTSALERGRIDLALTSFADLPSGPESGRQILAITEREDPAEALVGRSEISLDELPNGASLLTSTLRQGAQLLRARPDLKISRLTGPVESRLARLGGKDSPLATIESLAELKGRTLTGLHASPLAVQLLLPAPGQGAALVVTSATADLPSAEIRAALNHARSAACVRAERGFLAQLDGDAALPIGAWASWAEPGEYARGWLELTGRVLSLDGDRVVEGVVSEPVDGEDEAESLGTRLADDLMAQGAMELLEEVQARLEEQG